MYDLIGLYKGLMWLCLKLWVHSFCGHYAMEC